MRKEGSNSSRGITRREILGAGAALTASAMASQIAFSAPKGPGCPSAIVSKSESRRLGGLEVSSIGLGCMSMTSGTYNPPRIKQEMIPVIRGALERG